MLTSARVNMKISAIQPFTNQMNVSNFFSEVSSVDSKMIQNLENGIIKQQSAVASYVKKINEFNKKVVCACKQILLVDDDLFSSYALQMQLAALGFKVETAANDEIVQTII